MTEKDLNDAALCKLSEQDFQGAQNLFFENAKKHPSHQTFNNLGFYLISEGLTCKSGKVMNALKLGDKYLTKASTMKTSVSNMCALVESINYKWRFADDNEKKCLSTEALKYLDRALSVKYSNEIQYNYLRFLYVLNPQSELLLCESKKLIHNFASLESISLYFEILRARSRLDEGLCFISNYSNFLDEIDLLMFYSKFGLYNEAYNLCDPIISNFCVNKFVASAIIESCVNTAHFNKAAEYALKIQENENEIKRTRKDQWCENVFENINTPSLYRKELISEYLYLPPIINQCCYFGCKEHKINY